MNSLVIFLCFVCDFSHKLGEYFDTLSYELTILSVMC